MLQLPLLLLLLMLMLLMLMLLFLLILLLLLLLFLRLLRQPDDEVKAFAEFSLEILRRAEAHESAVDHDGESGAEGVALLHRVRRHDDALLGFVADANEGVPEEAPCHRIHASRRLVQQHLKATENRNVNSKPFLYIAAPVEIKLTDSVVHALRWEFDIVQSCTFRSTS